MGSEEYKLILLFLSKYSFEDELKPSICILLLKNSTNEASHQKNIYEIQKYQKVKSQKLYLNIVNVNNN